MWHTCCPLAPNRLAATQPLSPSHSDPHRHVAPPDRHSIRILYRFSPALVSSAGRQHHRNATPGSQHPQPDGSSSHCASRAGVRNSRGQYGRLVCIHGGNSGRSLCRRLDRAFLALRTAEIVPCLGTLPRRRFVGSRKQLCTCPTPIRASRLKLPPPPPLPITPTHRQHHNTHPKRSRRLPPDDVAGIIRQLASAVAYLHRHGECYCFPSLASHF